MAMIILLFLAYGALKIGPYLRSCSAINAQIAAAKRSEPFDFLISTKIARK